MQRRYVDAAKLIFPTFVACALLTLLVSRWFACLWVIAFFVCVVVLNRRHYRNMR